MMILREEIRFVDGNSWKGEEFYGMRFEVMGIRALLQNAVTFMDGLFYHPLPLRSLVGCGGFAWQMLWQSTFLTVRLWGMVIGKI